MRKEDKENTKLFLVSNFSEGMLTGFIFCSFQPVCAGQKENSVNHKVN